REQDPAMRHADRAHARTITKTLARSRHPDVPDAMRRWSGPGPEPGRRSSCGRVGTAAERCGAGQSPVPAASVSASRRAVLNWGAHGPWPAITKGDDSIDSKVSGSVTKLRAHSSIVERRRSYVSRLR